MVNDDIKSFKDYQRDNYNKLLNEKLIKLIENIPKSNGSRYFKKIDKNVGIITDEFMYNYYKDSVNLVYITYTNYKEIIENNKIDIFLFVSCWKGMNNDDWKGLVVDEAKKERIYEIIEYYKLKSIPTVFQSIEDPSNFSQFLDIAKKTDYIFTTDIDKIEDYKIECNNDNVFLSSFGVNPNIHNPIGIRTNEKLNEVLFAGSWVKRYEERCLDMVKIFDGVLESGRKLDIIDRNFNLYNNSYFFPRKYIEYTTPSVNHLDLQKIHKLYNWIINLNSIKYSNTMCAMRVYEAQALGNLILSNYSMAVNKNNPNVFIINNKEECSYILEGYTKEEIYKQQVYGVRNVMSNNTVFEKLYEIIEIIERLYKRPAEKSVLVIAKKITPKLINMFDKQSYSNKYLIEEKNIVDEYNNYDFVTFFNDKYTYEEYYIEDMINGFKYTDSDYITKDSYYFNNEYIKGYEYDYVNKMKDKYKTIFDLNKYLIDYLCNIEGEILLENGFSVDHFELIVNNSKEKIEESNLFKNIINKNLKYINSKINIKEENMLNKEYEISVIINVDNDGKHLLNKSFNSLKRSSLFCKMDIIIVNFGTTDFETNRIIERICRENNNVTYLKSKDENSTKADLINKSISISKAQYITFLNSYNEAVNDGYRKLLSNIEEEQLDMIIGNVLKVGKDEVYIKYCENETIIENPKQNFIDNKPNNILIEGSLIHKSLILNKNLKFKDIELLFMDLINNAHKIKVINQLVSIYYDIK